MKTGHFPALLLGHQNGQRNEATQCVNQSGFQNEHPRRQGPRKFAKNDFEQEVTARRSRNRIVLVVVLVLDGVDCSDWLRSWLEKFHLDSSVFSLLGRLIFESEDDDEHEDENPRKKGKIPKHCSTEISKKKPGHPDPEEPEGNEPELLFEVSLFRNPSSRPPVKSKPGHGKGSG